MQFGSGEGSSATELGGFNVDPAEKREMWAEGLDFAVKAMTEHPFLGYEGKHVTAPPRNVVPKPFQRPHPPLWLATSLRDRITEAAKHGMGALGLFFLEPDAARAWVQHYYRVFEAEAVAFGETATAMFAIAANIFAAPTYEQVNDRFADSTAFFHFTANHYYGKGNHRPGVTHLWQEYVSQRDGGGGHLADARSGHSGTGPPLVGTVDNLRQTLEMYESFGVDEILIMAQIGAPAKHEHIMESLELIGKHLIPELHGRHGDGAAERDAEKERLADLAVKRKNEHRGPRPDVSDYSIVVIDGGMKKALDILNAVAAGEGHEDRPGR